HRAWVERREPDRVDAQRVGRTGQVIEPADDPLQVSYPVSVRIGEAAGIDLVDDRGSPPVVRFGRLHAVPRTMSLQGRFVLRRSAPAVPVILSRRNRAATPPVS